MASIVKTNPPTLFVLTFLRNTHIPFGDESDEAIIPLPQEDVEFIHRFDSFADTPEERMGLPELQFTLVLGEELVEA